MFLLLQIDRDVKAICDTIQPRDAPCVLISNYTLMLMHLEEKNLQSYTKSIDHEHPRSTASLTWPLVQ